MRETIDLYQRNVTDAPCPGDFNRTAAWHDAYDRLSSLPCCMKLGAACLIRDGQVEEPVASVELPNCVHSETTKKPHQLSGSKEPR